MELLKIKEEILKLDINPKNQTEFIENVEIILDSPNNYGTNPHIICAGYNCNGQSYHAVVGTYYSFFIIKHTFGQKSCSIIKYRKKDILKYKTYTNDYKIRFYFSDINTMRSDAITFNDKENHHLLLKWFVINNNSYEN